MATRPFTCTSLDAASPRRTDPQREAGPDVRRLIPQGRRPTPRAPPSSNYSSELRHRVNDAKRLDQIRPSARSPSPTNNQAWAREGGRGGGAAVSHCATSPNNTCLRMVTWSALRQRVDAACVDKVLGFYTSQCAAPLHKQRKDATRDAFGVQNTCAVDGQSFAVHSTFHNAEMFCLSQQTQTSAHVTPSQGNPLQFLQMSPAQLQCEHSAPDGVELEDPHRPHSGSIPE